MDIVAQMVSGYSLLCSVYQWAAVVWRICGYTGATSDTPTWVVWRYDRINHISVVELANSLRAAVVSIGEHVLGQRCTKLVRTGLDRVQQWPHTLENAQYTQPRWYEGGQLMLSLDTSENKLNNSATMYLRGRFAGAKSRFFHLNWSHVLTGVTGGVGAPPSTLKSAALPSNSI